MKANPQFCKQTCEDLSVFNLPTIPSTKSNLSNKAELLYLVQMLNKNNNTLKKENQELANGFNKIMETNRDLYNSNKKYEDLRDKLRKNKKLVLDSFLCNFQKSNKLYTETSIMERQITTLQSLNDKYINENKLLESEIVKMWNEIENVDDFCKVINCFNKK